MYDLDSKREGERMASRRTIKEPESKGRLTVKEARDTAGKYRSAKSGRYVVKGHVSRGHVVKKPKR